jgi:hypothetical protein
MEGSFPNLRVYSDSLPKIVSAGGRHVFVEIVLLGNPTQNVACIGSQPIRHLMQSAISTAKITFYCIPVTNKEWPLQS